MSLVAIRIPPEWRRSSYSRSLLGVVWAVTAIATISLFVRLYSRYSRFTRFYWDDLFVVVAWAFSVPLAVQSTVSSSKSGNPSANSLLFTSRIFGQLFFYTCLWCIKISFLIFFRRISGNTLRGLHIYWKAVVGFTVLTYFGLWAMNPYGCFKNKGPRATVMAMPFAILRNVRLSKRQRQILYPLFSLSIVTMTIAIVRAVISTQGMKNNLGVTWMLFLNNIEASIAIIIACIGSLRALFTQDDR
ncbi:uncharacterized protein BDR25DRAFT_268691, partial [Lindgomyces ingoldianus]